MFDNVQRTDAQAIAREDDFAADLVHERDGPLPIEALEGALAP